MNNINIAVIGKTGAGKSALINYMLDENIAVSQSGKAQTKKGFHPYMKRINNSDIQIFDSWGLELDKHQLWLEEFRRFMDQHNYKAPVQDWIHLVFYCIDASSNRIQDADVKIINELKEDGLDVTIVFTKAAKISFETKEALEKEVNSYEVFKGIGILFINSVAEQTDYGIMDQFGKDELFQYMIVNYIQIVKNTLPKRIFYLFETIAEKFYLDVLKSKNKWEARIKVRTFKQIFSHKCENILKHQVNEAIGLIYVYRIVQNDKTSINFQKNIELEEDAIEKILRVAFPAIYITWNLAKPLFTSIEEMAMEMRKLMLQNFTLANITERIDFIFNELQLALPASNIVEAPIQEEKKDITQERRMSETEEQQVNDTTEQQISNLNVLLVGQTGVGKSSLINYVFEEAIRETGTGKPVTEKGFEAEYKLVNDVPVTLIDSWGLEQGKDQEWNKLLQEFLHSRGVETKVEDWVHVIIFCINASSNRIQDFEVNAIKKFIEKDFEVVVALTKAALCSTETINEMKTVLRKEIGRELVIVPVNSKTETLMNGMEINQFGRNEIALAMSSNYLEILRKRLPNRILRLLENRIFEYSGNIRGCEKTKSAAELAAKYAKKFWKEDVKDTIEYELTEAMKSYVSVQTVSMTQKQIFEHNFDYKDLLRSLGVVFGIGQAIRSIMMLMNPVLGIVGAILSVASLYELFKNRSDELAAKFNTDMSKELHEITPKLKELIIGAIDSMEENMKKYLEGSVIK